MVLIPVLGANLLEILTGEAGTTNVSFGVILAGFLAAFISGYIACKWMISLVRKSKLIWFSIYCAVVGLITIFFL